MFHNFATRLKDPMRTLEVGAIHVIMSTFPCVDVMMNVLSYFKMVDVIMNV